jgi:hypothetical protein
MGNESLKIQTALRFNKELLELIKEKAKAEKRSLNNYIEYLLYKDVENIPNTETIKAIKEARSNKNLDPINNLTSWLEEI